MAGAAEIRIRINSITETKKVTDAMYMISSVKMQRAKREMDSTRPYFDALREEIGEMLVNIPENNSRYFRNLDPDGIQGRGFLVITSDRGLSGSYNQTVLRAAEERIRQHSDMVPFIVGEYGRQYFLSRKIPFVEDFGYAAAFPTIREARRICADLLEYYDSDRIDQIEIIYTHAKPGQPGEIMRRVLLPLDKSEFEAPSDPKYYSGKEYLPDPGTVLAGIVPSMLTGYIYAALVESYCAEQEARMTAMNTAGKNAEEMLKKLRIRYNGIRQAAITREMTEITSGTKALRKKRAKESEDK